MPFGTVQSLSEVLGLSWGDLAEYEKYILELRKIKMN
jgi:hypothetical protein